MVPARPPSTDHARSRRRDAHENRRLLLTASAEVLAENPSASMDEIAARAGLGRATVYRHVAGRAELVHEVADAALRTAGRAVQAATPEEGSARQALRRILTALVQSGAEHRPLLLLGITRDTEFLAGRADVLAPITDVVRRGVATGELRADLDPVWAQHALLSLLQTAVMVEQPDAVETVWSTLIEGWLPR
ncbi:MAG TPA: TetR family transcriptional regulator [Microbacterium sp.]|nr:TetR family transcriptional regulator [Microbacterium sp.]